MTVLPDWLSTATAHRGFCGVTEGPGSCLHGDQGSWSAKEHGIRNLMGCAALCASCERCRHVSYSAHLGDCSWYSNCDALKLKAPGIPAAIGESFLTLHVGPTNRSSTARAPGRTPLWCRRGDERARPEGKSLVSWCLCRLASGSWVDHEWVWPEVVRRRCGFHYRWPEEARKLLSGRHLLFVGNSIQRRTMYALAHILGGANATLSRVPVEGEQVFDERKGYHGFQHVRITAATGRSTPPVLGGVYCGVQRALFERALFKPALLPEPLTWREIEPLWHRGAPLSGINNIGNWAFRITAASAAQVSKCSALSAARLRPASPPHPATPFHTLSHLTTPTPPHPPLHTPPHPSTPLLHLSTPLHIPPRPSSTSPHPSTDPPHLAQSVLVGCRERRRTGSCIWAAGGGRSFGGGSRARDETPARR